MKIHQIAKVTINMAKGKNKQKKGGTNKPTSKFTHRVGLIKDSTRDYTKLWIDVFLVPEGPVEAALMTRLFVRAGCRKADSVEEADLVVFGGGSDVTPHLYNDGEGVHKATHYWPKRDLADLEIYEKALNLGIPMVGICRGAQFLHVMNGGTLYQDVDNHHGDHKLYDKINNRILGRVSSSHHQMVRENNHMDIVAYIGGRSQRRYKSPTVVETYKDKDIEAFFYSDTCCFGVQGHPEYRGYDEFAVWFLGMVEQLIGQNPDIKLHETNHGKYNRLRSTFLKRRDLSKTRDVAQVRAQLEEMVNDKENA